jgi:A/G-specific adenine glycosylase
MPLERNFRAIRRKLLRWYDGSHRDLPWRRTQDPYAIWVAETMLQQTQVTTVVPYYERFLKCLPTIGALDRAPLPRVLSLWSGLGYYRRAENLKKSARILARAHGGGLPDDYDRLRSLPGVGAYTAGALMSIGFGKRHAAIDGNVRRVLMRMFHIHGKARIAQIAHGLVPRNRPGDFNQALMELGAIICTPRTRACSICPVRRHCRTATNRANNRVIQPKHVRLQRKVAWPLAIVRYERKILLRRRSENGMLARLWELPGGEMGGYESIGAVLTSQLAALGSTLPRRRLIGEIRHAITDRSITAPVFLFELADAPAVDPAMRHWRWFFPDSVRRMPISSMTLKALNSLAAYEKNLL